ncbi:MAG TPA: sodium:alanine symporter family protein [Candidatus Polarisedimenticolaceae bacterium]|nr:sodium:alanine symporter family protein [Candidatus Polarisedimenticolaceae bacterium]
MEALERAVAAVRDLIWKFGLPVGDETIPLVVIALLGTGVFLTLRLGFVQVRRLGHGFAVATGKYDDPDEPGDVSHFQALATALSATVGIGNIAGVAIAIHWGGPGALFWMWVTAALGMAVKYTEVTLAQQHRDVGPDLDANRWEGSVSGGPMYYIERGLGPAWKPMAVFFAAMLGSTAFLTGNAIQANTVADTLETSIGMPVWVTGVITAGVVAAVILGGITRIGRVTGVLAPLMAAIYVSGALLILLLNVGAVGPAFLSIFTEAFNPSAGVAGTGIGAILVTMMWGVNRGLFSNEAGQGSAPIAHAAAKTDEPVSEGVVALTEPFIDTIVICTFTAMAIIVTGVYDDRVPTTIMLSGGDITYVAVDERGLRSEVAAPAEIRVEDGLQLVDPTAPRLAWHDVPVERLAVDADRRVGFTGVIRPSARIARGDDGVEYTALYADAVESGAPLTLLAFDRGLAPIGGFGPHVVTLSVLLFGISTAIAWSYYGDRCATYLLGPKAVLPYKMVYVLMHFLGAGVSLQLAWDFGDVFLGIVILPNLIALVLLSGRVKEMTDSYFERRPWIENAEAHKRAVAARRTG